MAENRGNESAGPARPGAETLELLANPLNATILQGLGEGPKRLAELRRSSGAAPQTTVRAHLKYLEHADLAVLQPRDGEPRVLEWALTDAGQNLLEVSSALDRWLQDCPDGPLSFGGEAGKMAIKALVGGWSSTILCLLAAGPLTLTELAECIRTLSYPGLERRLSAMRLVGQVEPVESDRQGTPYQVTEWLREGARPLAAAIRWEYTHRPEGAPPLSRSDTEAAFLLSLPLLHLAQSLRGSCGLGIEMNDDEGSHCGVSAQLDGGRVVDCAAELKDDVDATATGTPAAWAMAMLEASTGPLELAGEKKLATGLVNGLHGTLFGDPTAAGAPH
ncbi:MAG TPA: winged helix-turn-helix transcriptional regulator [Solirubrobacterales bacterium]|nr:winged helix-turn-helix transcriptional regulator [Solirubrobacterales bacterium]